MTTANGRAATATTGEDADTDAVTLMTVDAAAALAGVSPRTVRRWIQRGLLPSRRDQNGHLISPADLPAAKLAAGQGRGHGHGLGRHGRGHGHEDVVTDADPDTMSVTVANAQARAQLEAIRDEWLAPLVAQIRDQAEEIGRLRAERGAVERQRDDLAAELTAERALRVQIAHLAAMVEQREEEHRRGAEQLVDVLQRDRDEAQQRVAELEERLVALTASETEQDAPVSPHDGPGAAEQADATQEQEPATGLRAWWRRVFGGT